MDQRDLTRENPDYKKEKKKTRVAGKERANIPPSFSLPVFRKSTQR